jgi:hypothetical protein
MAISRPFLLALLGAVLIAVAFVVAQKAREGSAEEAVPVAQPSRPEVPPADQAAAAKSPLEALRGSLSGKLESATFAARLELSGGSDAARLAVRGAFERGAAADVPAVELTANAAVGGQTFDGGFVAVDEKAYFTRGDDAWRVPAGAWAPVQRQSARPEMHPENWVRDARTVGEGKVDGAQTTRLSARVGTQAAVDELLALAPGLRVAKTVRRARIDAWVGADGILRRLTAHLDLGGRERGGVDFALNLTDVNEPQGIEAPASVHRGLPDGAYGRFVRGFAAPGALPAENPRRAARAVRAHRKVVIFFRNPRGLDDRAVSRAVETVRRASNAVVLSDRVDAVESYGKLVEDLGVSQTPSIALIDSAGDARLIEGFIDSNSLLQAVADAR